MGLADLKRVTDLFVEGTVVEFSTDPDAVALLWVNKLNSFELEEARRDGVAARSRVVLALKEIGTDEHVAFDATMEEMTDAEVVANMVATRQHEFLLDAIDDMRRDKDWGPKIDAHDRLDDDARSRLAPEELEWLGKVDGEFTKELQRRIDEKRDNARKDMGLELGSDELREKYREVWRTSRASTAFIREFKKTQLYFATRACRATGKTPAGGWDHSSCEGHRERALDNRAEVMGLPEGMLLALNKALESIEVETREARFSDALASSSASSAQQNEAAESTVSTPEATSLELVTTSS